MREKNVSRLQELNVSQEILQKQKTYSREITF